MTRLDDLLQFYDLLRTLEQLSGGYWTFDSLRGHRKLPARGVYFFFENGEQRQESGQGPRVTRVGTHGLVQGAKSTLKGRLSQHFGQLRTGTGNHRGSIFRLLIGDALMNAHQAARLQSWGVRGSRNEAEMRLGTSRESIKDQERLLEVQVSKIARAMPFLCLDIDDPAGPKSLRGYIERNTIGLLSNYGRTSIDSPSPSWLGRNSNRERVRLSGLWNSDHVDEGYDAKFLDVLGDQVAHLSSYS